MNLKNAVKSIDVEVAKIVLEDGTDVIGDVIIGADGIHVCQYFVPASCEWDSHILQSKVRKYVVPEAEDPIPFGVTTFRLLIPSSDIAKDPMARKFLERDGHLTVWDGQDGRKFITYPCRSVR